MNELSNICKNNHCRNNKRPMDLTIHLAQLTSNNWIITYSGPPLEERPLWKKATLSREAISSGTVVVYLYQLYLSRKTTPLRDQFFTVPRVSICEGDTATIWEYWGEGPDLNNIFFPYQIIISAKCSVCEGKLRWTNNCNIAEIIAARQSFSNLVYITKYN